MIRQTFIALGFSVLAVAGLNSAAVAETRLESAFADIQPTASESGADDRLLIVNGNTGRVVYDDGRNDLFCVTRLRVVGYNDYGRPIRKRTMRCR